MIDFLVKGGPFMIPLLICSIVAVTYVIERWTSLRKIAKINIELFMSQIKGLLEENKINEAISACESMSNPVSNVMKAGILKHDRGKEEIREAMEEASLRETPHLEKHLEIIGTIARTSPLLGLLGTVTGMIAAFGIIATQGVGDPSKLADGISQALNTTAFGLIIAVPTIIFYNYFTKKVDNFLLKIEQNSNELVGLLVLKSGKSQEVSPPTNIAPEIRPEQKPSGQSPLQASSEQRPPGQKLEQSPGGTPLPPQPSEQRPDQRLAEQMPPQRPPEQGPQQKPGGTETGGPVPPEGRSNL